MKKISTYLASALLMLMVLSSCSSRPEDINVADLKEPCDFVDAAVQVLDAIIEITEDVKSPEGFIQGTGVGALMNQLSEDDKKRGQALENKLYEIGEEWERKFGYRPEDIFEPRRDCSNNTALQESLRKLEVRIRKFGQNEQKKWKTQ